MNISEAFSNQKYQSIVDFAQAADFNLKSDINETRLVAVSFYYLENFEKACVYCQEIYPFLNSDPDFLSFYGSCLRKNGSSKEAEDMYKGSLQTHSNSLSLLNNYANLLIDLNRFEEAGSLLDKALKIDPNYDDAKSNLSRLTFLRDSSPKITDDTTSSSSSILDYDPLAASFSPDEIKRTFTDKAVLTNSDNSVSGLVESLPSQDLGKEQIERISLIRSLISSDPMQALADLRSLFAEVGASSFIYQLAGDIYIRLKLFSDADTCYLTSLSLGSNDSSILINLANLAHMRGDQILAFKWLEIVSTKTPDHPQSAAVKNTLFPNGRPSSSSSPFQYNSEQRTKGEFK